MRKEFGKVIAELVRKDKRTFLLAMDLNYGIFNQLMEENPLNFINTGVSEQATVGMASGMALEGLKPYVYSITPFVLERPWEQVKLDVVQQKADVKLVGYWDYPTAGPTHLTKDPELLCRYLNLKFVKPKDSTETRRLVIENHKHSEPTFFSLTKDPEIQTTSSPQPIDIEEKEIPTPDYSDSPMAKILQNPLKNIYKMNISANQLRKRILEKGNELRMGHYGAALSCLDAIKYLYDYVLRPNDLFILSKGHSAMALSAVLEAQGLDAEWVMHPDLCEEKGIYATTGSLGHGLPIGLGRAFGRKVKQDDGRIYVMLSDGEMEEGTNWEALMLANTLKVNLTVLVDWNKYQSLGDVKEIADIDGESLKKKLEAFGCNTILINGHDISELSKIKQLGPGLNAVVLDTIKGKGVSVLEENHAHIWYWHDHPEEYEKALEELKQ